MVPDTLVCLLVMCQGALDTHSRLNVGGIGRPGVTGLETIPSTILSFAGIPSTQWDSPVGVAWVSDAQCWLRTGFERFVRWSLVLYGPVKAPLGLK